MSDETYQFSCIIKANPASKGAILVAAGTDNGDVWIPRSQIFDHEGLEEGDSTELTIPLWLAERKGIV